MEDTVISNTDKINQNGFYKSNINPDGVLKDARRILILSDKNSSDAISAQVALALHIQDKYNKDSVVINFGDLSGINADLAGLYKINGEFEEMQLKIVVDYKGTKIDSANYYKDPDSESSLIIEIKPVDKSFKTEDRIKFIKEGMDFDVVITVGIADLLDLKEKYEEYKEMFDKAVIINYDISLDSKKYGKINIIDTSVDKLTKLVFNHFLDIRYTPDIKSSRALLFGLSLNDAKDI